MPTNSRLLPPATETVCQGPLGIIGGLGALAGADVFFKLVEASPSGNGAQQRDILLEQHPFNEPLHAGQADASQAARKLYVFDMLSAFHRRGVEAVLLPCFICHTFLDEVRAELPVPVIDLMEALRTHVAQAFPDVRRIGVLTSDYVQKERLFERAFPDHAIRYPRPSTQAECVMGAVYGPQGLKCGSLQGTALQRLERACQELIDQGAELILPGFTEIPLVLKALPDLPVPVLDCNRIYARHALVPAGSPGPRPFKIGIVGGVGPSATVDFMDKIVRCAKGRRDQDHIKLVVEQNPQIPDRTAALLGHGPDPTLALYAACRKLEDVGADAIAIPCNTAHAFLDRLRPCLHVPVVNMLEETAREIRARFPKGAVAGLLATDGTLASRVYHQAAEQAAIPLAIPAPAYQALVMETIYGPEGVKAGIKGESARAGLVLAIEHLVRDQGANLVILGCTELPLLFPGMDHWPIKGKPVPLVDPTQILAQVCTRLAKGA